MPTRNRLSHARSFVNNAVFALGKYSRVRYVVQLIRTFEYRSTVYCTYCDFGMQHVGYEGNAAESAFYSFFHKQLRTTGLFVHVGTRTLTLFSLNLPQYQICTQATKA